VDVTLTGTFDAFGLREEFAIGADFRRMRGRWYPSNASFGSRRNVHEFDPGAYPDPRTARTIFVRDGSTDLKQDGVFVLDASASERCVDDNRGRARRERRYREHRADDPCARLSRSTAAGRSR
jgi:hypothetical protein